MTCREAIERLYEFLDGELPDREREGLKEHLDECRICCERAEFERTLREVIREKCQEKQVSTSLEARIKKVLEKF